MKKIELKNIKKTLTRIEYSFSFSSDLSKYFTNKKFVIDYPIEIVDVPDSILSIPFVSNVLHIAWITNSDVVVPSLDKDFYNSLPNLKKAFEKMFPETSFLGRVIAKNIDDNKRKNLNKSAMFFSGGVDSFQTLLTHLNDNVDLISIWGSDIRYENEKGWDVLKNSLISASKPFNLKNYFIHSSFREFDNEDNLHNEFSKQLKDSWWHGLKHSIGLLGHVAPLAYLFGYSHFYIASTHSFHDKNVRCSSHPSTDNCVKFCGCQVVHDGFEYSRIEKIHNIVNFSNNNPKLEIKLHVCWETQTGINCCSCEKCARTIYAILACSGDPQKLGFENYKKIFSSFNKNKGLTFINKNKHLLYYWYDLAEEINKEKKSLQHSEYWKNIKWILCFDRNKPNKSIVPFFAKIISFIRRILKKVKMIIKKICFSCTLRKCKPNTLFLLGTPTHSNIGDSAITEAEIKFISDLGYIPFEITVSDWKLYKKVIIKNIKEKVVILHGGGNFGNLWPNEEIVREDILMSIKAKRFILMPQTFYISSNFVETEIERFKSVYDKNNIYLFAREKFSYEKMKQYFKNANVYLVPDIVLYLKNKNDLKNMKNKKNYDVLLILRNDKEGVLDFYEKENIKTYLKEKNKSFVASDMHSDEKTISNKNREMIISKKLNEFSQAKLIITDRLHGMIFAYLVGVPCIVLNNNNYKIEGVFEWIKDKSQTIFVENYADIFNKSFAFSNDKPFDDSLFNDLKTVLCMDRNFK